MMVDFAAENVESFGQHQHPIRGQDVDDGAINEIEDVDQEQGAQHIGAIGACAISCLVSRSFRGGGGVSHRRLLMW